MASHPSPPQPVQVQAAQAHAQAPAQQAQGSRTKPDGCSPPLPGSPPDDYSWLTPEDMALLRDIDAAAGHVSNGFSHHGHSSRKALPRGTRPVRFIGEGSANAVFEIKVPETSRHAPLFKGLLLRVAKVSSLGHAPAYDYLRQQKFFQSVIEPVLGDYTVRQELVAIHNTDIVNHLNKCLRSVEHLRKDKFKGTYVGQSDWGLLVEDMRPQERNGCLFFEFKPKWLLQSPSAPRNAIRCRQCAMELYHLVTKPASQKCLPKDKPCPLALSNEHAHPRVSSPLRIAWEVQNKQFDGPLTEALAEVANHTAISELRKLQARLDQIGPLKATPDNSDFTLAMTLRDCTCFVQIGNSQSSPTLHREYKIRLSDFDWKDPSVKVDRWRRAEEELIRGGFYTAEWIVCNGQIYHPPTLCLLEWKSRRRADELEVIHLRDEGTTTYHDAAHDEGLVQLSPGTKVYQHSTDLKILHKKLRAFRKEPPGTPLDSLMNPYRTDPSRLG